MQRVEAAADEEEVGAEEVGAEEVGAGEAIQEVVLVAASVVTPDGEAANTLI